MVLQKAEGLSRCHRPWGQTPDECPGVCQRIFGMRQVVLGRDCDGEPSGGRSQPRGRALPISIPAKECYDVPRRGLAGRLVKSWANRPSSRAAGAYSGPPLVPLFSIAHRTVELSPDLFRIRVGRHVGMLPQASKRNLPEAQSFPGSLDPSRRSEETGTASPADQGEELLPCSLFVSEGAAHGAGDHAGIGLLHPAHHGA